MIRSTTHLLGAFLAMTTAAAPSWQFFVSPTGNDRAAGTREAPFATLERARASARMTDGPGMVVLLDGTYLRAQTFQLGKEDRQTTYRADSPGKAVLCGGRELSAKAFQPLSDPAIRQRLQPGVRGRVLELDLKALDIRHAKRFPELFRDGGGILELYANGQRLPPSRWPNKGYTTIKTVLDSGVWSGSDRRGGTFAYRGDRPKRWLDAVADGLWLDGFWRVPWQPEKVRVAAIDPQKGTITHASWVGGGIGSKYTKMVNGTRPGNGKENWVALNLLEEIDQPGEWCVHFPTQTLYLLPPRGFNAARIVLADMDEPLVELTDSHQIRIEGLVFEGGLGNGVEIHGGGGNVLAGCEFRNLGKDGAIVSGGQANGVQSCDFHDLGHGGVMLGGGDRRTLAPAGNYVDNCHIRNFGQVKKTYAPGVGVGAYGAGQSVGNRISHNLIHHAPHAAVLYGGNDNLFEFNEVHHVAQDSGDVGAFYTWHDWTSRGNVLRHNFVYDSPGCNAFYMDDGDSGDTVFGNVIVRTHYGPFIGGGHDNLVRNNICVELVRALHLDDRGVSRHYNRTNKHLMNLLGEVDYQAPPWSTRYPALVHVLDQPELPTGNVIENNVTVSCKEPLHLCKPERRQYSTVGANLDLSTDAVGFTDPDRLDYSLRPDSPVYQRLPGFQPIPFARIGLYADRYRHSVPVRNREGSVAPGTVFDSATDIKASNTARP